MVSTDEQKRLTASWLNILGAGTISAGAVTQLAGIFSGDRNGSGALVGGGIPLACLVVGFCLHLAARSILGGIGRGSPLTDRTLLEEFRRQSAGASS